MRADSQALFEKSTLSIEGLGGAASLNVEIADTDPKRAQGLMFRRELAPNTGMLFLFDREEIVSMWMKNTYIPLDMVFIDANWRVINVATGTEPHSLEPVSSASPALRVLEIGDGRAAALGIKPGALVTFGK